MTNIKTLEIKFNHLLTSLFLWNYKTAFKGNWLEFSNFKNYEEWEDSKNIDWLVSAREWKILTKQFEENRELEVLFLFDISESMNFWLGKKKIDTLIELFYILWLSTLNLWWSIWWVFLWKDKEILWFSKWKASLIKILKKIDSFNDKNYKHWDIIDFKEISKYKNKLVFIFTDKLKIDDKNCKIIWLKNDLVYINVFDNFENTLSWVKWNIWIWWISLNLDNKIKKKEYIALRENKIKNLKKRINIYWWDYLNVDNKSNLYKKLLKLMKERQR